MGDRTPIEVVIYACPPEAVGHVLDVLEEFGLDNEYAVAGGPGEEPAYSRRLLGLELGCGYSRSETLVGTSHDVTAALTKEAAWKVWENPAFEHLGQVYLNHPDLGMFESDCDAQGRAVFNSDEVDTVVELTGGDRVQIGHHTGRTWEMAFESLATLNNGIVIPRDTQAGSAPMQAAALNQLATGPASWLPPDAPGRDRVAPAANR